MGMYTPEILYQNMFFSLHSSEKGLLFEELADKVDPRTSLRGIRHVLNKLIEEGLVEKPKQIPGCYRLTPLGKETYEAKAPTYARMQEIHRAYKVSADFAASNISSRLQEMKDKMDNLWTDALSHLKNKELSAVGQLNLEQAKNALDLTLSSAKRLDEILSSAMAKDKPK